MGLNFNTKKLTLTEIFLNAEDIARITRIASVEARKVKDEVTKEMTSIKQKQTDTKTLIDKHIQDKEHHQTEKDIKSVINPDIDKFKQDTDKNIKDKIDKAMNGKDMEIKVKEMIADTMVKYHQTLWTKRGFWTSGLTK